MHNTTFIPHTSSTQPPSSTNTRSSDSNYHSVTKTGLKRRPSSDSLVSIGRKPPRTVGGTGTGTRTGTRTIISTSTTATTIAKTSITAAAAAASSSASSSSRGPLRRRNQNAAPVTIPLLKEPGTGNMPFDTSSPPLASPNPNSSRSQMPSLSASAARVVNRNPLTPKIASKTGTQSPALSAAVTPTGRRQHPPSAINTSREAPSNRSSYFDDSSFPSHLSTNVTPRSGSRQTRVESAGNTPNGTPNPERLDAWDHRSSFGLPSPRIEGDAMRRSGASFGSVSPDTNGYGRQEVARNLESKFFHASDVKPPRPTSSSKPVQAKGPTFFYANGNTIENKPSHPVPFAPVLGHSQDSLSGKFVYANGTPEARSSPTPPVSRSSGSTVSTAPRPPSSRPATNPPANSHTHAQRPASPAKLPSQGSQASSRTANIPSSGRPQALSAPQLAPSPGLRRSSTGTSRPGGHSRAGSLVKLDHGSSTPKPTSSRVSPETSPPITVPPTPAPLTLASIIQAAEEFAENEECASPEEAPSGLQSPTNPANPTEPVNESVANARRERKVQDLQITNASLEAINRTLERRLRKQTSELRRYQRLSRAGRLSTASTAVSSQVSLEDTSEQGIGIIDLSDLDEKSEAEEEQEEEREIEEELSDSDSLNESLDPSVVAERDAKHRKRDEERLQLDLSNHQQLLVDSQKINQSIRRCLDWTEVLINEGKKALEYRVPITGVELGGRVLAPDEEEDRPSTANSISDNTIEFDEKFLDDPISLASWGGSERQDRDSGIELQVDGG
ncbi:uncharacterized protein F4817DRAFT_288884 [Daldinia loculata]|uniref:uncharacterized protein n=1 Tax=Daldinia loculata TaxID=103429 RepID=UPI0020C55664|nr:uncharacterized protein F4817DRAFT_288884 [Daldinia loculata]KAI1642710.1 hypothetical protein F4817DRAFT_288884 [Daldinia loculata]